MSAVLVHAIGLALVHFLWEGAVLALILAAVLSLVRRANLRYRAASLAMLGMLAAFAFTAAWSFSQPRTPLVTSNRIDHLTGTDADGRLVYRESPLARLYRFLPQVVLFWMAGALLLGLYRLGGWLAVERMRRAGVCAVPSHCQGSLRALAHRMRVSKPVVLMESSLAQVPMVIGLLRPAILVPAGLLTSLPPAHLEAILLHELAHIRRFDYLVNLLQTVAETLLFYHPAVWWISGLMRAEREHCCDDLVVAVQGDARAYAEALVTLEERRFAGTEPALAATGGKLMNRIGRLLNPPEQPRAAVALILSMALLLGVFCLAAVSQTPTAEQSRFEKWLNEDVAYLVTPQERSAFEHLTTDDEREHFIEQFWERRNPTPGASPNTFKEEHYRRIAYANQRFSSSTPGWKTDRGRIYIQFGPPDELEAHPDRQQWLYRSLPGIGTNVIIEFVDPDRTGEYRMTRDPDHR